MKLLAPITDDKDIVNKKYVFTTQAMSQSEAETGTATAAKTISPAVLRAAIAAYVSSLNATNTSY